MTTPSDDEGLREEIRKRLDKLPTNDQHMNRLANILDKYARRQRNSAYQFNRRDIVLELAVEVELLISLKITEAEAKIAEKIINKLVEQDAFSEEYSISKVERYQVRHKELDDDEVMYQLTAVEEE